MPELGRVIAFLVDESSERGRDARTRRYNQHLKEHLDDLETGAQLRLLQELLCVRPASPPLPEELLESIDLILRRQWSHRVLTRVETLTPTATITRSGKPDIRLILWKGDITTLSGVSAITNAANSQMLGCFQPSHRCIDNVIHSWAGPRLRQQCLRNVEARDGYLGVGEAALTPGYCLPSPHVVHTVGPQLQHGASPSNQDRDDLAACYKAVLEAAETIATDSSKRKSVALCGISTGLFAFPVQEAAPIAVRAVSDWIQAHLDTTITDIIFNTFVDADHEAYREILAAPPEPWISRPLPDPASPLVRCDAFAQVHQWLDSADNVLISAGAGLSAATGLDYTSKALFSKHFPAFHRYGLTTLYSVFGFTDWPSEEDRWGYYFTHLGMVRGWPLSPVYEKLIKWLDRFGENAHVRTSNADGFFLKHGLAEDKLSTPQGCYAVLQCLANCRPDATVPSQPLLEAALPTLGPTTQRVEDPDKVPYCKFCGSKMMICVRAAQWFNEKPFAEGETRWKQFQRKMLNGDKNTVILEFGAGMSTPGVLRWPNEDLVANGGGKIKLVRIGLGTEVAVDWDLEDQGLATSIEGDIAPVVSELFGA